MSAGDNAVAAGGMMLGGAYLVLGIVQFLATMAGIQYGLGIPSFIAFLLAFFIGPIPIIGTITGIYGAVAGWGLPLAWALALFLGGLAIILILGLASRS